MTTTGSNPDQRSDRADAAAAVPKRPLFAASIGTFIEFFDYASYSYVATTLAVVFFPQGDPALALLQTFMLFAISFAMRPIGGLFWGHFGDRIGRKRTLGITIVGIGLATTLVGLLPGYATIGLWAPALLVLVRLFQSFCTAGEYSGAAVMLAEYVPRSRRARYVSVVPIGCALGFLAASLVASILYGQLDSEAMTSWGWRVPFLLAAPMALLGIYIRTRLDETPDFAKAQDEGTVRKAPLIEVFRAHKVVLLKTLAVMGVNATGYYLVLGYMATYLEVEVGLTPFRASVIMTTGLIVYIPLLYLGAILADRFGRKRVLLASAVIFLGFSFPIFLLLGSAGFIGALVLQVVLVATFSLNDSTFATFFSESFPTSVRLSGFAMPFNVGVALFGGTAPLVASWLIERTGNSTMPAFVMMFVAALGVVALVLTKETPPAQRAEPELAEK